jgi:hypothetical protein
MSTEHGNSHPKQPAEIISTLSIEPLEFNLSPRKQTHALLSRAFARKNTWISYDSN